MSASPRRWTTCSRRSPTQTRRCPANRPPRPSRSALSLSSTCVPVPRARPPVPYARRSMNSTSLQSVYRAGTPSTPTAWYPGCAATAPARYAAPSSPQMTLRTCSASGSKSAARPCRNCSTTCSTSVLDDPLGERLVENRVAVVADRQSRPGRAERLVRLRRPHADR